MGQERRVVLDALENPAVQAPLVKHMVRLARSDALPGKLEDEESAHLSAIWLPSVLLDHIPFETLANATIEVSSNEARMEVSSGGWEHGWTLEIAVSHLTAEENLWGLFISSADDSSATADAPLFVAEISDYGGYTQQDLLKLGLAGNERFMEGSLDAAYWNQITLNLWAGESDAAHDACRRYHESSPDAWVAVLLWSLVVETKSRGEGEALLRNWATREPGFPRYIRLAQFYELTGQADELASALQEAARNAEGEFRSFYAPTYHAAAFAIASGHPNIAVVIADVMLKQIDRPEYWHIQDDIIHYHALKQIANQANAGKLSSNEAISVLTPIGAEEWGEGQHLNLPTRTPYTILEQLLQRPVPRLTEAGVINLPRNRVY